MNTIDNKTQNNFFKTKRKGYEPKIYRYKLKIENVSK